MNNPYQTQNEADESAESFPQNDSLNPYHTIPDSDIGASWGAMPKTVNTEQQETIDSAIDLDADTPKLSTGPQRKINKKAVLFLLGIAMVGVLGTGLALKTFFAGGHKKAENDELVAAPTQVPLLPSSVVTSGDAVNPEIPAIPPLQAVPTAPIPLAVVSEKSTSLAKPPSPPKSLEMPMSVALPPLQNPVLPVSPPVNALVERRKNDGSANNSSLSGNSVQNPTQAGDDGVASVRRIYNPDNRLLQGTFIRCVMQSKIITDVKGFVSCNTTESVYSFNGKTMLLPRGTKISGQYHYQEDNANRVDVVWGRALTPDGVEVNLNSPSVDSAGASGIPGELRNHWGVKIGAALMTSLIGDALGIVAAKYAPSKSTVSDGGTTSTNPFESKSAQTMQKAAEQALAKAGNRRATVTIPQGSLINIYTAHDIDFSAVIGK